MAETPIINASPLIYLSKAGLIDLLQLLSPQIFIPDAVATEILRRGDSDVTAATISQTGWLQVIETPVTSPIIQAWDLGMPLPW